MPAKNPAYLKLLALCRCQSTEYLIGVVAALRPDGHRTWQQTRSLHCAEQALRERGCVPAIDGTVMVPTQATWTRLTEALR